MEKSISPLKYDKKYFSKRYQNINFTGPVKLEDFEHIYRKVGSMFKLGADDKVVDMGCGVGQFSLYLYLKYKCDVTGIDYSADALYFCRKNIEALSSRKEYSSVKEKVRFLHAENEKLPDFRDVKAVFLVDILEHLYDEEIEIILEKIKSWKKKDGIYLVIHTDNNNYLRFVRPVTDFIAVCLGYASFQKIKEGKDYVMDRHINLTTANKLKKKLTSRGFEVLSIEYPAIGTNILKNQLGPIGEYRAILYPIYFLGKIFYFLRPSFYMLAKHG